MSVYSATHLIEAAKTGNIPLMEAIVASGVGVNDFGDYPALVWACNGGHLAAVRWLLDKGAEPDKRSPDNLLTPLMTAASQGHMPIVQVLVDAGASPQLKDKQGRDAARFALDNKHTQIAQFLSNTPDEVSYFDSVADRVVQEVYSFKRRERFTFVRKSEAGDVEAVQRERFSDLGQDEGLRRAFNEHVKRGGKLAEEEVFSGVMSKLRKTLPVPKP